MEEARKTSSRARTKVNMEENAAHEYCSFPYERSALSLMFLEKENYTPEAIREWLSNPEQNIASLRKLGKWLYYANGSVHTAVEYMRTMHTLDGVPVCKNRESGQEAHANYARNRKKMTATLRQIRYKEFIRDALFREATEGMQVSYLEVNASGADISRLMSDMDVMNITEINELGVGAAIISLPIDCCRLVGRRNGVPVIAFDLRYFLNMAEPERRRALGGFPAEIRNGFNAYFSKGTLAHNWLVLDEKATICTKICSAAKSPFGIPFTVKAAEDVLYQKKYSDTKSSVLDNVMTEIFYQVLPAGAQKGLSSLTQAQQKEQHNTVKSAVMDDKKHGGRRFVTVATGTEIGKIGVDTSILKDDAESGIQTSVASSLGISPTIIAGEGGDTYASASLNAEYLAAYVYSWISDLMTELNKAINAKIIKDPRCVVDFEILPTTYINKDKLYEHMRHLYTECGGSLSAVVASTGMNIDSYLSLMDWERAQRFEEKYPPHVTSYTASYSDKEPGRPSTDSKNPSTIKTGEHNGNAEPKPSV